MKVAFFNNGNTIFLDNYGNQSPSLQKSWFLLYIKYLEQQGVNPLEVKFSMPDGCKTASLFKTPEGNYAWEVE